MTEAITTGTHNSKAASKILNKKPKVAENLYSLTYFNSFTFFTSALLYDKIYLYVKYIYYIIIILLTYKGGFIMDIRQMKYFKTIVEEGTISKAAQVLHMAQPPLSIQLKQLEEELGITLLKRGNKQIELTDAGMRFYKRCLQILDLTEITKNELKESFQDVLRIGITSSNGGLIQQDNIKHFIEHYDHVQYRIYEGSTYEILDLLLSHNIDLGIVRTPFDTSKVNTFYLEKEPMIVIGKKEYFKRPISKMKDLKKIPLIIHQRYLPLINDYSLNKHIQIQIKVTCDDSRTSLIWANSGIGVAIVPLSSLSLNYDSSLEYAYLEDKDLYTGIAFITRKNEETPILINQFIECFK